MEKKKQEAKEKEERAKALLSQARLETVVQGVRLLKAAKKPQLPQGYSWDKTTRTMRCGDRVLYRREVAGEFTVIDIRESDAIAYRTHLHQQLGGMQVRQKSQKSSQLSIE